MRVWNLYAREEGGWGPREKKKRLTSIKGLRGECQSHSMGEGRLKRKGDRGITKWRYVESQKGKRGLAYGDRINT